MEVYHMVYIFALLLVLKIAAIMAYTCIKNLHLIKCTNEIPGIQFGTNMIILKNLCWNKNMLPATTILLQILCGFCQIFDKSRIFTTWISFRPFVIFYKPETVQELLRSNSNIDKSKEYNLLQSWFGNGLLLSTGDKWRAKRKLLTPTFHLRILEEFIPIYNEKSRVLVEKMKRLTDKEWVDVTPLVAMCALDIICETTMGVPINAQENCVSEYVKAVIQAGETFMFRALRPWFWFDSIFYLFPIGRQFRKNVNVIHSFTRKVIKDKKELLRKQKENTLQTNVAHEQQDGISKGRRRAFLELLLELQMNDNSLSEEDVRGEVDFVVAAGHDPAAVGINWALYNIGLYPDVQEKIQMELESIFRGDSDRHVTSDDLKAMKYLDCVLKESLRLYPSIPLILRELREDIQVLNYTVPKGSVGLIFPYALHRDPESFPNPELFDPDRFLPENCAGRHPYAYIPFSAGPRNCMGQKFAVTEEKIVVSSILRNFIVKSLDERDKLRLQANLILRNTEPLKIKLIPRKQK